MRIPSWNPGSWRDAEREETEVVELAVASLRRAPSDSISLTGLRCRSGAMGTVGAPAELQDDSAVDQAVEKRSR